MKPSTTYYKAVIEVEEDCHPCGQVNSNGFGFTTLVRRSHEPG